MSRPSLGVRHVLAGLIGRFRATKHVLPTWLPHWAEDRTLESQSQISDHLSALLVVDRTVSPIKGDPNLTTIRREIAGQILSDLRADDVAAACSGAALLAGFDMRDTLAYETWVGLLRLANAEAISSARSVLGSQLVMHISCAPRVMRAHDSVRSFEAGGDGSVQHLIVVGSKEAGLYRFDPASNLLTVPVGDSYEQLPAKVISALTFLSLLGNVCAVLKVDDDHRLISADAMAAMFRSVAVRNLPCQAGELIDLGLLGLNSRVWHFGKTSDRGLTRRPYTYPGTSRYVKGSGGYFVNGLTLALMRWSLVYFADYVNSNLYEDVTLSDLIERQGGRLIKAPMQDVLSTYSAY